MARPSKDFLMAWSSLSGDDVEPGWRSIALPPSGPLDVRAGRRSPDNAEAVLVGFPTTKIPAADKLPEGQGFSVERADLEGAGRLWIALSRKSAGSPELFAAMSCDVIGALDDAAAAGANEARLARVCIGRVGAWQEFMRKGTQTLSPEAEIGLIGELVLLRTIIRAGVAAAQAIESWVGPLDGIQDFEIGTGALEVKATLSSKGSQPEMLVRRLLFSAGYRFRLHRRDLPGTPDMVLPRRKIAIFVHGCFWHMHAKCKYAKLPSTRPEFWQIKLAGNVERDQKAIDALMSSGWRVLTVWECATRNVTTVGMLQEAIVKWIESGDIAGEITGPMED